MHCGEKGDLGVTLRYFQMKLDKIIIHKFTIKSLMIGCRCGNKSKLLMTYPKTQWFLNMIIAQI